MERQPRIVISRSTTWERLVAEVARRRGTTFLVVGVGTRARRLLDRLAHEMPNAVTGPSQDSREHTLIVNTTDDRPLVWGSETLGEAPRLFILG